jgi:hypothetical protein
MKVLKSLITIVILLFVVNQIKAQADTRCKDKYSGGSFAITSQDFYINTEAAKSQDGAKYKDFTIYARPKKNDVALLEITQKGTWFKGVYSQNRTNVNDNTATCDLCARDEFKSGSFSLEWMQGGRVRWYIAEAKKYGRYQLTHRILNFEELDQDHDWEIRWND